MNTIDPQNTAENLTKNLSGENTLNPYQVEPNQEELIIMDTRFSRTCSLLLDRYLEQPQRRAVLEKILREEIYPYLESHPNFKIKLFQVLAEFDAFPEIQQNIVRSLTVPQVGEYHNEGPRMISHLALIIDNLQMIQKGQFPEFISPKSREMMKAAVSKTDRKGTESVDPNFYRYAFLHDLSKADCLTVKSVEKVTDPKSGKVSKKTVAEKEVTWEEWLDMEATRNSSGQYTILDQKGNQHPITSISYFHDSEENKGLHGNKAVDEHLGPVHEIPQIIKTAIRNHEIAYQFSTQKAAAFQQHFGGFNDQEQQFILTSSYIDSMSSFKPDGSPDLENFQNMITARNNFILIQRFVEWCKANGKTFRLRSYDSAMSAELSKKEEPDPALRAKGKVLTVEDLQKMLDKTYDLPRLEQTLLQDQRFSESERKAVLEYLNQSFDDVAKSIGGAKAGVLRGMLPAYENPVELTGFKID